MGAMFGWEPTYSGDAEGISHGLEEEWGRGVTWLKPLHPEHHVT